MVLSDLDMGAVRRMVSSLGSERVTFELAIARSTARPCRPQCIHFYLLEKFFTASALKKTQLNYK